MWKASKLQAVLHVAAALLMGGIMPVLADSSAHVSTFFNAQRNGDVCGVYPVTDATYNKICVVGHENCGHDSIFFTDLADYESGRYCPGAFHPAGWPESICPPGKRLEKSYEAYASSSGAAECLFSRYLKTIATCGHINHMINAVCGDIQFGVNVSVATAAANGSNRADALLGKLLLSFNPKAYLLSWYQQRNLQFCLWYKFDQGVFSSIANGLTLYFNNLQFSPSDTVFFNQLKSVGC